MSIQLVLAHYLAGLRERDELDALLPDLLKAMGHSVLSRPQIGVSEAGVDVLSTKEDENGAVEVFLFVIKFGDIGRDDFYVGSQAVEPSIRQANNDFVRNRLPEPLRALRKRIVLITNGVRKKEIEAGFSALSEAVAENPQCSLDFWGIDQLTPLIEQYLFDETLLLSKGKSDLRAALAGLEESNTAIHRFVRFVESCFVAAEEESAQGKSTRKKKFLKRCATASMGWAVLLVWGQSEGNLKPGVVAGEYLALRMWAEAVKTGFSADEAFIERFEAMMGLQAKTLIEYFEKVMPHLRSRRAVLAYRPERPLYAELVFEELGRLATLLLLLQRMPEQDELRTNIRKHLLYIVNEHTGCRLPVYDGQTIDLTLLLVALMGESDWDNAQRIVSDVTNRLHHALRTGSNLPVDTDLLEDAVALNVIGESEPRDFFETSSLIPALATVAALLGDDETLKHLRDDIQPLLQGTTLERWFPDTSLETLTGSRQRVQEVGVSRAIAGVRATVSEEAEASLKPFKGAAVPTDFKWHGTPWMILVALSARIHRHPVPTWFLAEYARPAPA
ncbi:hypothetical protein [Thiobacillus sp.]|uniref:hypothetical protein n=1 Tax=Thiobacillus sp. TaxID=924 RepID=UPI00286DFBBF|nr:hypothetical protein [Thiobacillus sp.]